MDELSLAPPRNTLSRVRHRRLAPHGWTGLALLAAFWPLNWWWSGPRTYWCYFPLWWGLALTVDALCLHLRGTSLLTRHPRRYVGLALLSIPAWWVFEAFNALYGKNWYFVGGNLFLDFPLGLLGAGALSAVMPVMFGSAELIAGTGPIRRLRRGPILHLGRRETAVVFLAGLGLLGLVLAWPHRFFALIWLGLSLVLEAVNLWRGRPALLRWAAEGDWRPMIGMGLGGLVAGVFSELWNYYAYPRWSYDVPFGDFWHAFELPLLGYAVFLTVGWELYALYHFVAGRSACGSPDHWSAILIRMDVA